MTALKILGIIVLIFLLIGFLRFGAIVTFGDGLRAQLRVGPVKLTVYPRRKKAKKKKKAEAKEPKPEKEKKPKKAGKAHTFPKPTLEDIMDLIETAFRALGAMLRRTCRRVRIDPLELTVVFGGWDPANVAEAFGAANTILYAVMPKAEETFYIPDPSIHLRIDYTQEWPSAKGAFGVSLRVCDLFAIIFALILPLAKWFLRFKKAHRHDDTPQKKANKENEENENREEKIA